MNPLDSFEQALLVERISNRFAMEHDSPEALNSYLKEHPEADRGNHSVKKTGPKNKAPAKDSAKSKAKPVSKSAPKSSPKPKSRYYNKVENGLKKHWGPTKSKEFEDFMSKFNNLPEKEHDEFAHRLNDEDGLDTPEGLAKEFFPKSK